MYYVSMTDRFMSGWGRSGGLINKLVIGCSSYSEAVDVRDNAESRSDMEDIEILDSKPLLDEDRFHVSWGGVEQGTYENWFKSSFFAPRPQMSKREIESAKGAFLNIGKVFTTPTHTLNEDLHNKATDQRLVRLLKSTNLTAKQSADFVFKLTDAEKITLLSKASEKAPLAREHAEEMQRLFLKVYGETAYRDIFGTENPPEKEEWVEIWGNK